MLLPAMLIVGTLLQVIAIAIPTVWQVRRHGATATWGEVENPPSALAIMPLALSVIGIVLVTAVAMLN